MKMKSRISRLLSRGLWVLSGVFLAFATLGATRPQALLDLANPRVLEVIDVQEAITPELMAVEDILGTAVGVDAEGELSVIVYVNAEGSNPGEVIRALPRELRGNRLSVELTDPFTALKPPSGSGNRGGSTTTVSHKAKQTLPIQLGTSGGWRTDLANGYCCGGTLGSLISKGGKQYILSNYHVFESDIVSGGNGRIAATGDLIIQPGLIDVGCNANNAQNVATLVKSSSLPGSNVDAAIAEVIPSAVRSDGAILEIGTISSQTVGASVNQAVKKSGRTTGLTRSTVAGLNAAIKVTYDNECAGGTAFTKTFTGQIVINNRRSKFLAGGDSGSLMVEDVSANPRAVGLLFAGSSLYAIANPIDEVLGFFGASMVGN